MEIRNCTSDDGSVCEWEVRGGAERACAHDYSELCVRDFERLKAEVERLEAELAGETLPRESCHWTEDDDGNWETECGNAFCLEDGPPKENSMRYCCYCGRKLEEVLYVEPQSGKEE